MNGGVFGERMARVSVHLHRNAPNGFIGAEMQRAVTAALEQQQAVYRAAEQAQAQTIDLVEVNGVWMTPDDAAKA